MVNKPRYIAIEGVIGAGKTSLAQLLASALGARLVLERFDLNPFLPAFYHDPERFAFQTQMFFLISRYRQLMELNQPDLFHENVVCDYTFMKDEIFARLTLDDNEFGLYRQFAESLADVLPAPDIIVFLQSEVDRLLTNISLRARAYEQNVSRDYLARLQAAYHEAIQHNANSPVLVIDTNRIDFVRDRSHFEILKQRILETDESGLHYFTPVTALF